MLHPSPELQKQLELYQTIDRSEAEAIKYALRRARIIRATGGVCLFLSLGAANIADYGSDVHNNQEIQANAIITIEDHGDPLQKINSNIAIVSIDGYGTVNADGVDTYIAPIIQKQIQDGRRWGVSYNDAPLKPEGIADKIVEKADDEGVDELVVIGQSGGGDIAMQVEERIRQTSGIGIAATFLMATPNGVGGLQRSSQQNTEFAKTVAKIPGAIYSTPLRFAGEMAFRSHSYTDGSLSDNITNFINTGLDVNNSINEKKLPGAWLMVDQVLQIENADLKTRIQNLGNADPDVIRTPIFYLGMQHDPVVNERKSANEIGSYSLASHVPFFYYDVPGAVHGQPGVNNDSYVRVLTKASSQMKEVILNQEERAAIHEQVINAIPGTPQ